MTRAPSPTTARAGRLLWALFGATLLLILAEPGHVPLFEPDEGRYAEIPREMLAAGDLVTPRLNGVLYFEKPPLYYWSVAASFRVFGETEFAARLPGKLASVGMALLAFAFARRRWGERAGVTAGLLTAASLQVFVLARIALIDSSLSFALAAAVFAFAAYAEADAAGERRRATLALYGFHVACAAAVMLKGLVGIVLPGGAIVLFTLLTGRWRTLARLFSPGPLLVFLALAVPWHVAMAKRHPDFLSFYFVHEHFDRFAKKEHRREGPLLYFVPVLLVGLVPWTGFLVRLRDAVPARLAAMRARPTELFLALWSLLVFLFFSVSSSKLIPYLEPIWPAVAVLLAVGIERARERDESFVAERRIAAWLFGALLVAAVAYGFGGGWLRRFDAVGPGVVALTALGLGFGLNVSPRFVARGAGDAVAWIAAPWLLFLASILAILPGAARVVTPWPIASVLERELKPDDLLLQRGHFLEVVPFYAKRLTPITALGWSELDFGRSHAGTEPLFPSDGEFASTWNGPRRVFAVVHRDELKAFSRGESTLRPPTLWSQERSGKHVLVSNR